jgi:hypothetical protein
MFHLILFVGRKPPRQEIAFISDSVKANNLAFGNELAWKNMTPHSHFPESTKNSIDRTQNVPSLCVRTAEKAIMSL